VPAAKLRRVLTENKTGAPLRLQVRVVNARTCAPLPDAAFEIWHCDAEGIYSGFTAMGSGFGPGGPGRPGGPPPGGFGRRRMNFDQRAGMGPAHGNWMRRGSCEEYR
jgi:protocatechuate 3,4-dioxygenase beta subunit